MASMVTINSPSSHSKWTYKYEVFLSFRGADTRKNFTDHLYTALDKSGINTFRDDEKLQRGTFIAPELMKAIEESRIALVILSRDYASSRWCLIELAKIIECNEKKSLIVLPVFHYVNTSDVRNQNGIFVEVFAKHEECFKDSRDDVQTWRAALTKVASISGWDLENQYKSKVIEDIVKKILAQLNSTYSIDVKNFVGINSRMKELEDLLGMLLDLDDIRFIGIWGMGGIGKTTLAQVVYNRFKHFFEGSSFLACVREESRKHDLVHLQKRLLSDILIGTNIDFPDVPWGIDAIKKRICSKKVLVILDDVDHFDQLKALAGEQSWFGKGSRIIITTRDKHILTAHGVVEAQIYKAKKLDDDEGLKLFSQNAFNKDYPLEDYVELSQRFIYYAGGLPLALKVLGSSLCLESLNFWESALAKFKENPPKDILAVLQISYDGLEEREKNIFLDIACFFKGAYEVYVTCILQSLYEKPNSDINVLLKKSLITISRGYFWMHDLLEELGREIVRLESPEEAGRRSRLWHSEDVLHVLKNCTGTQSVEGIILDVDLEREGYFFLSSKNRGEYLSAKAFSEMKNLSVLIISDRKLEGLTYLSNKLCYVIWDKYPLESLPTDFELDKLVELHLRQSLIKKLWKGTKILEKLKLIDLSHSTNLIETPDFSGVTNLEQLILSYCTRLFKIHESLGNLKRLIRLDLNGCKCLESLPNKINLERLEVLILSGCSRFKKFPNVGENMKQLIRLDLKGCKCLKSLPNKIKLERLEVLILSGCSRLKKFPDVGENMTHLSKLYLDETAIEELPLSVEHLSSLIKLDLSRSAIKVWPILPKNLEFLNFEGCEGLSSKSSNKLLGLPLLQTSNPERMHMLNRSLSRLCSLTELNLSNCGLLAIPDTLGCLSSLKFLYLNGNNFVDLPKSIVQLSHLSRLGLGGCKELRWLPELPSQIYYFEAADCTSLETLALRPGENFHPPFFSLLNCVKLMENQGYYRDMLMTILRQYVQKHLAIDYNLIIIPGREIPKWFSHQSEGDSLSLDVPSDLLINNICKGIAVCALFVTPNRVCRISWFISVNGLCAFSDSRNLNFNQRTESNSLLLKYYPSSRFKSFLASQKTNYFLEERDKNPPLLRIEIEIRYIRDFDSRSVVTNCGAHLVYDENNIEYVNQTQSRYSSCVITPYEDDLDNSTKGTYSEEGTRIKRSRGDHDDWDGAEPSGEEGPSIDIDIQLPNLFQRLMLCLGNWIGSLCAQRQADSL